MATPKLTGSVRLVLDLLLSGASASEEVWGLRICEQTSLGPGTVYPILDRLQRAGWVTSRMEPGQPSGRPPRRYYEVTAVGRAEYRRALDAQNARLRRWISATDFLAAHLRGGSA